MRYNFNIKGYTDKLEDRLNDALAVVGAQVVSFAADNLRKRSKKKRRFTGNLINSLCYSTIKVQKKPSALKYGQGVKNESAEPMKVPKKLSVIIGSNVVYARMQEYGGVQTPSNAKMLTIPLNEEAARKNATDFNDLFVYTTPDRQMFLARKEGKALRFYYLLTYKANIPARPYLRPAIRNNKRAILQFLQDAINGK